MRVLLALAARFALGGDADDGFYRYAVVAAALPGCGVLPPRDKQEEGGLTLLLHHQQAR